MSTKKENILYFSDSYRGATFELFHLEPGHNCCLKMVLRQGKKILRTGTISDYEADILKKTWSGGVGVLIENKHVTLR